jgi:tight adherence protein B
MTPLTTRNAAVVAVLLALAAALIVWPPAATLARLGVSRSLSFTLPPPTWRTLLPAVVALASAAALISGWIAALLAAFYGFLGARALVGRSARHRRAAAEALALDALGTVAADLRAGLPLSLPSLSPPSSSLPSPSSSFPSSAAETIGRLGTPGRLGTSGRPGTSGRLGELAGAAERLAERTGAPVADLLDRIEADARASARTRASTQAQAAGAHATAVMLAVLPLAGVALGFAMNADPLHVLLHTRWGGVCALAAAVLQGAGLLWSERIVAGAAS